MSEPQDSGTRGSHSLSPIIPTTDPELVGRLVPNLVPLAGLPADTCAGNQVFALTGADDVPQLPSRSPFRLLFLYLGEHGCRPPGHPTAAQGSLVASADLQGKGVTCPLLDQSRSTEAESRRGNAEASPHTWSVPTF